MISHVLIGVNIVLVKHFNVLSCENDTKNLYIYNVRKL